MPISQSEGRRAVELARETLESFVGGKRPGSMTDLAGIFAEARGVFVTLKLVSGGLEELRGCIGFPYPVKKVAEAIREATVMAASEDPRFPPVAGEELGSILVEVSILSLPKVIAVKRPADRPAAVKIGEDGLIVSRPPFSGLLLPQVATEQGLDSTSFLEEACMKAGLPPDSWLDESTEIQSFKADVYSETRPRGDAVRVELSRTPKRAPG